MPQTKKGRNDRESAESRQGMGRRAFVRASVGGAVAATVSAGTGYASAAQRRSPKAYHEESDTPIVARHQVVIAGGGPGGFIAALASVRSGADTLLIERYGFLGGNGTAGLMTCYNGFRNQRAPEDLQTVKGIPAEYIAEIVRLGGVADADSYPKLLHDVTKGDIPYCVGYDHEVAKVAALNMIKKEGVELLLHSLVVGPMLDGSRVTGVIVESKSGRQAIAADIVIDATGDGDIAARAGAPFMEPLEYGTGNRMGMSLMYRLGGLPSTVEGDYGGIRIGDRVVKWGPWFAGDGLDVRSLTQAEVQTRLELWDDIQEMQKEPGMESVYLLQSATNVGVRETRRILGEYVVTEQDAIKGTRFPDVIAISSNPMPDYHGERFFFEHPGFDVPYRSLVPKKVEGLVLTGRCISCAQGPFQSARSMAPAMAIGHASGCAAAMAARDNVPPRKLDVKALQKTLLSQNAELRMNSGA
jgi:hypothetical protein